MADALHQELPHERSKMNKFKLSAIAIAVSFAFSSGAIAQSVSKKEYKEGKDKISVEYKLAKESCASLSGNQKDICVVDAKGKEKVAKAELEASYKPSRKSHYNVRLAKADAVYSVSKERCDDLAGNAKGVCVKEAKAAKTAAKADAKVQMKTSDANATANEKITNARSDAKDKTSDIRKDAAADKLDAQYAVEKEKCDKFAGGAKDNCLADAKKRFSK